MDPQVIEKFYASIDKTTNCWNWLGFTDKANIPIIRVGTYPNIQAYSARRVSLHLQGNIQDKKHAIPYCRNQLCVNPDHLVIGDAARFWAKVHKLNEIDGCWIWLAGEDKNGYGKFNIMLDGKKTLLKAHAYSWELYTGRRPPKNLLVCHTCDTPRCVNPNHLWLGTRRDNNLDCVAKGRNARGDINGNSKLTEAQVLEIRRLYDSGLPICEIAKQFPSVIRNNIGKIGRRQSWKHLS